MPFWTAVDGVTSDPKRVSRFKVEIGALNNEGTVWYAKSFSKPSAEVKFTTHRYLNHSFNYPGSVTWKDVTIELIDPTDPIDAAGSLAQLLEAMGYQIPSGPTALTNISKRKSVTALGDITVIEVDDGGKALETWDLKQAFVSNFEWGSLKYDGDDLNILKLTIKYDWASCVLSRSELTDIDAKSAVTSDAASAGANYWVDKRSV